VEAKIVDAGGKRLRPGEVGELVFRGPNACKGYWNLPELTKEKFKNGWLHTGDHAYKDEDGYFFIVGRENDLIITMGYNVYPREIEEIIYKHPDVLEVGGHRPPSSGKGRNPQGLCGAETGSESQANQALQGFCRAHLALQGSRNRFRGRSSQKPHRKNHEKPCCRKDFLLPQLSQATEGVVMLSDYIENLLDKARIFDLGQPIYPGMPHHPNQPPFGYVLLKKHGDITIGDQEHQLSERPVHDGRPHGHPPWTHWAMWPANNRVFNDIDISTGKATRTACSVLSIDETAPVVRRGMLAGYPRVLGLEVLPNDFAIGQQELRDACSTQQVEIQPGDVVLIRTGWIRTGRTGKSTFP
jgi:hypothetical protein